MKLTEKEVRESLGLKMSGELNEQEKFMLRLVEGITTVINKSNEGQLTDEQLAEKLKALSDTIKEGQSAELKQLKEELEDATKTIQKQGETIEKLTQKGFKVGPGSKFDEFLTKMFDSDQFKDFASKHTRKTGVFDGITMKDVVSMTDNYEGDVLISRQEDRVVDPYANKPLHLRDIITAIQGDPKFTTLTWTQIVGIDRNARYVTENGRLPKSSISVKEVSTSVSRLGTHMPISRRMLKSRTYIRSKILAELPEAIRMAEDWNMLFGDGNGENLLGIANTPGVEAVEKIISEAIVSGKAGSILSITPYNDKKDALVEFVNPQPDILDGMMITLAGAVTNTTLNATHAVVKVTDRQVLLLGVAMTEEETEANLAKMTFTVNHSAFKSIEAPNTADVVQTAFAVMTYGQFYPTAIVLNPITVNAISTEKDALGRNLGLIEGAGSSLRIAGRPIIQYTGIPAGKYMLGDFNQGANIVDYTNLTLEWADDVESKLQNQVVLIAQEEVIFPVYNPFSFAYGDLNQLKAAITKPVKTETSSSSQTVTTQG